MMLNCAEVPRHMIGDTSPDEAVGGSDFNLFIRRVSIWTAKQVLPCCIKDSIDKGFFKSFLYSERVIVCFQNDLVAEVRSPRVRIDLSREQTWLFEIVSIAKLQDVFP